MTPPTLNPLEVRERIGDVDARLALLLPHLEALKSARQEALRDGDTARVAAIERGLSQDEGRPADPRLAGFEQGLPGLTDALAEEATLGEKRLLLEQARPSAIQRRAAIETRAAHAAAIAARLEALAVARPVLAAALAAVGRLALEHADEEFQVWQTREELLTFCREHDIDGPAIPAIAPVSIAGSKALGTLLIVRFSGARPGRIPDALRRDLELSFTQETS